MPATVTIVIVRNKSDLLLGEVAILIEQPFESFVPLNLGAIPNNCGGGARGGGLVSCSFLLSISNSNRIIVPILDLANGIQR